jgi:hypothetical protein
MLKLARKRGPFALAAALALAMAAGFGVLATAALALEEPPDEWDHLKDCEKRLCAIILGKDPKGDDLKCRLSKTWAKSSLKNGEDKGVSWGFGDARCALDLTLSRADVIWALTKPKHTVRIPAHTVNCQVERGNEVKPMTARLSPKLKFKDGQADKVWINLEDLEGPDDIKGTAWIAANLEDKLGIFHAPLIKSINKFMHTQCAKRYGPEAKEAAQEAKGTEPATTSKPAAKPAPVEKAKVAAP